MQRLSPGLILAALLYCANAPKTDVRAIQVDDGVSCAEGKIISTAIGLMRKSCE